MTVDFDTAVIGAGVVGLALAREAALAGQSVVVLERNWGIGQETSARNSEVIHAGIYYPPNSLKARLCVRGKELLYGFLRERGLRHQQCGKVIIAVEAGELPKLEGLKAKAAANGVNDLELIDGPAVHQLEPAVKAVGGLFSPSTGIVDSHAFMLSLQGDIEAAGGNLVFGAGVEGGEVLDGGGYRLRVGGEHQTDVTVNRLIIAAGLGGEAVARRMKGLPSAMIRPTKYAKGHYFKLQRKSPFNRLVYPVPVAGGLGTHATIDLGGQARFGPDVQWIDEVDYSFDESRRDLFLASISRWLPSIRAEDLVPDYTGIRPKLAGPGEPDADFVIEDGAGHGAPGLILVQGIESPGLTSSLAIAEHAKFRLLA